MSTTDVPAEREELLPCPFCGEEPHLHEPAFVGDDWQVGCQCGDDEDERNPGAIWRNGKTFEEVAARWNRRAAPQEAREPEGVEKLMSELARIARLFRSASELGSAVLVPIAADIDNARATIRALAAARPAPEGREPDASELRDNIAGAVQDAIEAVVKKRLRETPAMNRAAGEIMAFVAAARPAPETEREGLTLYRNLPPREAHDAFIDRLADAYWLLIVEDARKRDGQDDMPAYRCYAEDAEHPYEEPLPLNEQDNADELLAWLRWRMRHLLEIAGLGAPAPAEATERCSFHGCGAASTGKLDGSVPLCDEHARAVGVPAEATERSAP